MPKMLYSFDGQPDKMMYNNVKYSCINMKYRDKTKGWKCMNNKGANRHGIKSLTVL